MNNCTNGCNEQQICMSCQEVEFVWLGLEEEQEKHANNG